MAKQNKPIPKTQKEISDSFKENYLDTNPVSKSKELNRANEISWKGEDVKPLKIGIREHDEAVVYYIKNIIKPFVIHHDKKIDVPVLYGNPEKWVSFQSEGHLRDKNGELMLPLMLIKRNSIEKNRQIGNKLDANNPYNYGIFTKKYSKQNSYSQFQVLKNRIPEEEYLAVVYPDHVTITYDCILSTYYVSQMNQLIEAFNYASDSYWGDPENFKFKVRINNFQTPIEYRNSKERIVKSEFQLILQGYIIPDNIQKDLLSVNKFNKKVKISFEEKTF